MDATSIYKMDAKFRLPARPEQVKTARMLTDVVLLSWALRHLTDPALLIVSELCTNAVQATPGKDLFLLLNHEATAVCLGVWDAAFAMPVPRSREPSGESGRGLRIVAALADDYGSLRVEHPKGKIVWARLRI